MTVLPREYYEQLAADLIGEPGYWLLASEGRSDDYAIHGGEGSCGNTGPSLDLTWRPILEAERRWHGRAPAIFLNDVRLIVEADALAAEFHYPADKLRVEALTSVAVHELAHVAESGIDRAEPTPDREQRALAIVAYSASISLDDASPFPSWFGHDWQFVRHVLHLAHRAAILGYRVSHDLVYPHCSYGLPRASAFLANVDDEPSRLLDVSPFDLAGIAPPKTFCDFWRHAMEQWRETNPPAEQVAWAERQNYLEFD